jgi:hypothetical protein
MRYLSLLLLLTTVVVGCQSNPVSTSPTPEDQAEENPIVETPDSLTYRVISPGGVGQYMFNDLPGAGPVSVEVGNIPEHEWTVPWFSGQKSIQARGFTADSLVRVEIWGDDELLKWAEGSGHNNTGHPSVVGVVTEADLYKLRFQLQGDGQFKITVDGVPLDLPQDFTTWAEYVEEVSPGSTVLFEYSGGIASDGFSSYTISHEYPTLDNRGSGLFLAEGIARGMSPYSREFVLD